MFNEVERIILDSFVECPHCQSKNVECVDFTTTMDYPRIFTDLDGHGHRHDPNRITAFYICNNEHEFSIIPFNSCWCGWNQKDEWKVFTK